MGLYENIKNVAKEKGISINKLEKELGFARSSISKYNSNDPGISKVMQISDFLGVSIDYLVSGGEDSPEHDQNVHNIAAHHDTEEWTDEELKEVEDFKNYILSKRANK